METNTRFELACSKLFINIMPYIGHFVRLSKSEIKSLHI